MIVSRLHSIARFTVVLALVASTQGFLLAQSAWLVNQDWIAETLCVNRFNPEMDCDGKCQLADRMEKMNHGPHSHDQAPTPLLELAFSVRAHVATRVAMPEPASEAARGPVAWLIYDTGREASQRVFHPPRLADTA